MIYTCICMEMAEYQGFHDSSYRVCSQFRRRLLDWIRFWCPISGSVRVTDDNSVRAHA